MTSGAVRQVIYGRVSQIGRSFGERETHVLDVSVVWGYSSGDGGRATSGFCFTLLNFGPLPHPHGYMLSNLWLAVPGHDGVLAGTNLRLSKPKDLVDICRGRTSSRARSWRVGARLWGIPWAGRH